MLPNNKNDANPFLLPSLMNSKKYVTPVETGVRKIYNYLEGMDSGLRWNRNKQPPFWPNEVFSSPSGIENTKEI